MIYVSHMEEDDDDYGVYLIVSIQTLRFDFRTISFV